MKEAEAFGGREDIPIPYIFAAALCPLSVTGDGQKGCSVLNAPFKPYIRTDGYHRLLHAACSGEGAGGRCRYLCRTMPEVKRASREASVHKGIGFDRILSALRDENMAGESLSEYVFNFYRFSFLYGFSLQCPVQRGRGDAESSDL